MPAFGEQSRRGYGVLRSRTSLTMETPPAGIRRIIIVGAGGFGREVVEWARAAWPDHANLLAGFLSADPTILARRACELPILTDPARYEPRPGDGLLLAIGIPLIRRKVAEDLLARGATFITLIHPSAIVCPSATIGPGSIVCPHAIVSDAARLNRCVLINYHSSMAHDSVAGDFAVLSPYAALAGGASVGEDAFLGIHASVGPGVMVGARSKVAANSCALHDVPSDSLVHGVPGRVTPGLG